MKRLNLYAVPKARLTLKARALLRQMLLLEEPGKGFVVPLVAVGDNAEVGNTASAGIDEFSACFHSFLELCKEGEKPRYYSWSFASALAVEGASVTDEMNSSAVIRVVREKAEVAYDFIDLQKTPKRLLAREGGRERERRALENKAKKAQAEAKERAEVEGKALRSAKDAVTRRTDALADKLGKRRQAMKASVFGLLKASLADDLRSYCRGAIGEFIARAARDEAQRKALAEFLDKEGAPLDFTPLFEKTAAHIAQFIEQDYRMLESNVKTLSETV